MRTTFITTFAALLSAINALTFTSPAAGVNLDPTQAITVTWTSSSSDPATFDLVLSGGSNSLTGNLQVGQGISTSTGSYTIPANTAVTYGANLVFQAQNGGVAIGTSNSFSLSIDYTAVTSNGQTSYAQVTSVGSTANAESAASTAASTSAESTNPVIESTHRTGPTSTVASDVSSGTAASTMSSNTSSSRFTTSTTSRSSSSASSSASSASATTSANAQARLGSNSQMALGAAGFLTGLIALLV